ncbi:MAG TPA: hypothetical protein VF784_13660 [Anaerolineales bacterium]
MDKRRAVLLTLIALGAIYFALFVLPNSTGARDLNMTYIFNSDEPAQYVHMVRMLTPASTLPQSIYRFLAYQHYFYGFPYYFYATVFGLLPAKIAAGLGNVRWSMLFLRQIVSVLPMIVAAILLVYMQTDFRSYGKSIVLFAVLLLVPEVVYNDMWLHPESLVFLLIVLTLFFLVRDDLRFGWNFYLGALFCGLAVATKLIGLFYFLSIPLYIFLGWYQKHIDTRKALIHAGAFVAIMAATFIVSNPFLYWQSQRTFALTTQTKLHQSLGAGFIVAYHNGPAAWLRVITDHYGVIPFLVLSIAALVIGMVRPQKRLLNLMILAWSVPFMLYIMLALAIRASHFPLPILLPVFSALPAYFTLAPPERQTKAMGAYVKKYGWRLLLVAVGIVILAWQLAYSLRIDIPAYFDALHREQTSPSLQYFSALDRDYLSRITANKPLVVFRDVAMYVPDSPTYDVHFQWGVSGYPDIQKINPDLIILSVQHCRDYTQPGQLEAAVDPNFAQAYKFYSDALSGNVSGYTLLYRDGMGMTFLRAELYDQFFR